MRIFNVLDRLSTKRHIVILFIITVIFPTVIFPLAGIDAQKMPDAKFYYTGEQVVQLLQSFTPAERSAYFLSAFFIDVLYPVTYSLLLAVLITRLLQPLIAAESRWNYLRLLPFAAALFDLLENVSLAVLLSGIDRPVLAMAKAAVIFTPIKWSLVFTSILLILFLFIKNLVTGRNK